LSLPEFHEAEEPVLTPAVLVAAPRRASGVTRSVLAYRALELAGVALIGLYLAAFVPRNVSLQWDLDACLTAARTALGGMNPYRLEDLARFTSRPATHPWLYPPIALLPFLGLTALPAGMAGVAWIAAKVAILIGLVALWSRWFAPRAGLLAVALVAVFGWNGAALHDLRTGNVALVECALLWSAFACWVAGRRALFATLVVAASVFKLMPAMHLLLLLVPCGRRGPEVGRCIVSVVVLAALVWAPFAIGPIAEWQGFLRYVPDARTLGDANPSALALATVIVERLGVTGTRVEPAALALWALYGTALVAISGRHLQALWKRRDGTSWVAAAVTLELLLAPRPMAYGFVHLGAAPLLLAASLPARPGFGLLLALILSAQGLARAAHQQLDATLVVFSPLLLTLGLWLLAIHVCPAPPAGTAD
jgi:hypothetical protein